ncbi:ABC transporter permease [Halobacteriales archaeon QH_8_64_26]|nr:MAG: ABC transporter permease [Halobacteriales archaeon QH_8_64_26]
MGYKRALLLRWSRRDRLTVLVVAVTIAFLVGSGLLLIAVGAQTSTIASEFTTSTTATYYDSYGSARAQSSPDALVFPTANVTLTDADGGTHTERLLGVPPDTPPSIEDVSVPWQRAQLPPTPDSGVRGPVDRTTQATIDGRAGTLETALSPHPTNGSVFPERWYVANVSTVEQVGLTGALVLDTESNAGGDTVVPRRGTAILAALVFFLAGMNQLLGVLALATVGGAVLVLVVVYNVVRMTVRDRMDLIKVIRATGGTPRGVLGVFGLRAGLLVTAGTALGYAIGVIVTNAIVNVAIYAGLPISITPTVTRSFVRLFGPALLGFVAVGILAGTLAARPATTTSPARFSTTPGRRRSSTDGSSPGRLRAALGPRLLDTRALVPTAMTLAVFALVVILATSLVGALAPLAGASGGTVTEAGAPHIVASSVDAGYAPVIRSRGIDASPEILLMQAADGEPFLVRGANYTAFAGLSETTLRRGYRPRAPDQAVIGRDLARTLDIGVGDRLTLGGSTSPSVSRVQVVGVFDAPGIYDDELLVPLETAYGLSNKPGVVQFIRTSRATDSLGRESANGSVTVTSVAVESPVVTGKAVPVRIQLQNLGEERRTHRLEVELGTETRVRDVSLPPGKTRTISVPFRPTEPGDRTLRVGSFERPISVVPRNALSLPAVPDAGPPGETMLVAVRTVDNRSVPGATVTLGEQTARTGPRGVARVELPSEAGTYTLSARKGDRPIAEERIEVAPGVRRQFVADLRVTPETASVLARPTANVTLANPWGESLTREVTVTSPTRTMVRNVTLGPGELTTAEESVVGDVSSDQRASPGTYTVRVLTNGEPLASTEYTIQGDDRLFAALASSGSYSGGTGIGRAVESLFGNLQLLLVAMVALAALTTIGSTTATFAQAVHARRQAIGVHRATGATYGQLLRTVLLDALRLSIPATAIALLVAFGIGFALEATGALVLFGIRLSASPSLTVLLVTVLGALVLSSLSAVLATIPFLLAPPTTLLADSDAGPTQTPGEKRPSEERPRGFGADD